MISFSTPNNTLDNLKLSDCEPKSSCERSKRKIISLHLNKQPMIPKQHSLYRASASSPLVEYVKILS